MDDFANGIETVDNKALKPIFSGNMMLVGREDNNLGKIVKNTMAKLNANILPQKKQYSPPKNFWKHSMKILPNKSPKRCMPESQKLKAKTFINRIKRNL